MQFGVIASSGLLDEMPAGHLPSFSHFLPESDRPTPMEQLLSSSSEGKSSTSSMVTELLPIKPEPLLDLNNNHSSEHEHHDHDHEHSHHHHHDLLLPPPNPAPVEVELLGWDSSGWSTSEEVTPLTNLLADPLFLPFDTDSNKVDWEPSSSSDPFASTNGSDLICWTGSGGCSSSDADSLSLLRHALTPHRELRKVLSYPVLSDVALSLSTTPSSSSCSSSVYYELLVEPDVVIPTHVEELCSGGGSGGGGGLTTCPSSSSSSSSSTLTISTTTHSNQSLSAKWTYTTTNPDGTPKGRKRAKKPKLSQTSSLSSKTSPNSCTSPSTTKLPSLNAHTLNKDTLLTSTSSNGHHNSGGSSSSSSNGSSESSAAASASASAAARKERSLHYCTICSKGFKDKYSVNVHVRTHTGEKPFACTLCGKAFRQKAHLAKHHQTHAAKASSTSSSSHQGKRPLSHHHANQNNMNNSKTITLPSSNSNVIP